MVEEITEIDNYEYDSSVVAGMPEGQRIKWSDAITTSRIHILDESEPMGAQKLRIEDIIGELNKVPPNIRKYIWTIVLTPYPNPYNEFFRRRSGREVDGLAFSDYEKRQIIICPTSMGREKTKETIAKQFTLIHETGHIIDATIQPPEMGFFAYTPKWTKAICEDTKVTKTRPGLPSYLLSDYAEDMKSLREDFADSVVYFSDEGGLKILLRENFPNRYRILEDLLNDQTLQ